MLKIPLQNVITVSINMSIERNSKWFILGFFSYLLKLNKKLRITTIPKPTILFYITFYGSSR